MKRPALRDLIFVPGQLLCIAVIFLPFADGLVPARLLVGADRYADEPGVGLLALPAVLVLAVVASTVRQALAGPLSRVETWVAWGLSAAALLVTCFAVVTEDFEAVIGPTFLLASVGAIAVLAFTRKGRLPPNVHAHVALLVAWVVNGTLAVVSALVWAAPDGGCWVAAGAVAACALEAALRTRDALRRAGEAASGDSPRPGDAAPGARDPREIAYVIPELAGAAALFLPFTWKAYRWASLPVLPFGESWPLLLANQPLVPLLSAAILASTVRQAFFGPLTRREIAAARVVSLAALVATSLWCGCLLSMEEVRPATCSLVLALAVGAGIMLSLPTGSRVPPHVHAHVGLLVAWMPNAVLCLVGVRGLFSWGAERLHALIITAFVAYAAEAAVRVTLALRRGREDPPGPVACAIPDEPTGAATGER